MFRCFSVGKAQGDRVVFWKYLKNCHMQEGLVIFFISDDGSKTNRLKLKGSRFQIHTVKKFLTLWFPGEVPESPSLDVTWGVHSGAAERDSAFGMQLVQWW